MPYGNTDLSQMIGPLAWRHQAINWTKIDLSVKFCGIHLRAFSLGDLKIPISKTRLKIAFLKSHPDLPAVKH